MFKWAVFIGQSIGFLEVQIGLAACIDLIILSNDMMIRF